MSFDDADFGRVTWAAGRCWTFDVRLNRRRSVPATFISGDGGSPPTADSWGWVRECVELLRSSELAVRAFIRERLAAYPTRRCRLSQILFRHNRTVHLYYVTPGDSAVVVKLDSAGRFLADPLVVEATHADDDDSRG